jgi:hypothetical protein
VVGDEATAEDEAYEATGEEGSFLLPIANVLLLEVAMVESAEIPATKRAEERKIW